jgi:hypothetical protein
MVPPRPAYSRRFKVMTMCLCDLSLHDAKAVSIAMVFQIQRNGAVN